MKWMSGNFCSGTIAVLFVLLAWMTGSSDVLAHSEPLSLHLEQFTVVKADDGTGAEQLLPFADDDGAPGTVIEYQLIAKNVSDTPLGDIILRLHVPLGTRYIEGSEQLDRSVGLLQFSIDAGESYRTPPILYVVEDDHGDRMQQVASADMYTDLRFVLLRALVPGEEVSFAYRVLVE